MKSRGVVPPDGVNPTGVRVPVDGATANTTRSSAPRFEPSTHAPEGCTHTSAAVFVPVKPAGNVDTVCVSASVPASVSSSYSVIVLLVSLIR